MVSLWSCSGISLTLGLVSSFLRGILLLLVAAAVFLSENRVDGVNVGLQLVVCEKHDGADGGFLRFSAERRRYLDSKREEGVHLDTPVEDSSVSDSRASRLARRWNRSAGDALILKPLFYTGTSRSSLSLDRVIALKLQL
ncbi:hypothetical protein F7725_013645 [Dissostichus mawsoni]|uniref:Uncharacterized protein n=1 Tax=Dissostichus mawsoni TaxID=36200 RepID=A0A7J5YWS9_DISMA|nr:hypothetical protein F7725_013645 [Dissostichus mawsoni]